MSASATDYDDDVGEREFGVVATLFASVAANASGSSNGNSPGCESLTNDHLLYMYARYKQATAGPCRDAAPSFWRGPGARAKWHAWSTLSDMTAARARCEYVARARLLLGDTAVDEALAGGESGMTSGVFGARVSVPCQEPTEVADEHEERRNDSDPETLCRLARGGHLSELQQRHKTLPIANRESSDCDKLWCGRDLNGLSPIHWAADRGHLPVIEWLIDVVSVPVDLADSTGQTALHHAACGGHRDVVASLLARGASIVVCDEDDMTPVDLTADCSIVKLLTADT